MARRHFIYNNNNNIDYCNPSLIKCAVGRDLFSLAYTRAVIVFSPTVPVGFRPQFSSAVFRIRCAFQYERHLEARNKCHRLVGLVQHGQKVFYTEYESAVEPRARQSERYAFVRLKYYSYVKFSIEITADFCVTLTDSNRNRGSNGFFSRLAITSEKRFNIFFTIQEVTFSE